MKMVFIHRRTQGVFFIVLLGVVLQYLIICIVWRYFSQCTVTTCSEYSQGPPRTLGQFTCVFRDFDPENNNLLSNLESFSSQEDVRNIVVVSDRKLYPPVSTKPEKTIFFELEPDISPEKPRIRLDSLFSTEWVLLIPDMISLDISNFDLKSFVHEAEKDAATKEIRVWGIKVKGKRLSCHSVLYDHKHWTLYINSSTGPVCDGVTGSVIFLIKTSDFLDLAQPFAQPMDESLLVQAAVKGWKVKVLGGQTPFSRSERLLEPQVLTRVRGLRDDQIRLLYERMSVKKTVKNGHEELFGCSKTSPR